MTFGLISWLKSRYADLNYEVPLWFPSRDSPDHREWLVTNGLGGFSCGTVTGANRRRYHGLLFAALKPPRNRHVILSRVDESVQLNGTEYKLATNQWASGVVSPTGYKRLEAFTILPAPTWVFEIDGHYLIKQVTLLWGTNELYLGYWWLPNPDRAKQQAELTLHVLTGFRPMHGEVKGSSDYIYPQFVSPRHSLIMLNEKERLCLSWSDGSYEAEKQWWWDYHWPEEAARGVPDTEDLFLAGSIKCELNQDKPLSIAASLNKSIELPSCHEAVESNLKRQRRLLVQANLPRSPKTNQLVLACDQFLVSDTPDGEQLHVVAGYPWFNDYGRAAIASVPGLTIATRRFDDAKRIFRTLTSYMKDGILPNRFYDDIDSSGSPQIEYAGPDVTLIWAWALFLFDAAAHDHVFLQEQFELLKTAAQHLLDGTNPDIKVDSDGLLHCSGNKKAFTWMDATVADIPITPRNGKAVELCALWYNFIEVLLIFAEIVEDRDATVIQRLREIAPVTKKSMQKFWNSERQCLFDVIETVPGARPDESLRPNQLIALAVPSRAFEVQQEKAILIACESELLVPMGLRTLATTDPSYQGMFGCGFAHADQYHRDLSYHQGTAWMWLLGMYCQALLDVHGPLPETAARINLLFQPILTHLLEEAGLGSISEIFDGDRPHAARGAFAHSMAVAETMRWHAWQMKR